MSGAPYLHRHLPIIDDDLAGEEIRTNGRLVARAELLVDLFSEPSSAPVFRSRGGAALPYILVHQTRLADTAITKDDDLSHRSVSQSLLRMNRAPAILP